MEEQEEGREYKNKERKKNDIKKKKWYHSDFSEEITAELSRLLAVNSSLHVTFIPLMVSPRSLLTHMYLLHFHLQYEKQYQKHLEIDVYLYLSLYTCAPSLILGGKRKKVGREKLYTLIVPRKRRRADNVGKGKRKQKKTK